MIRLLFFVPILAFFASILLYRHNGKREILRFDLVQFFYSFIVTPMVFIWLKSFLFFLLRKEFNLALSLTDLFIIDTVFSTTALFVYAFVVIHALTASFKLRKVREPLSDLFFHSEYFHLWLSHLVMYVGVMLIVTFFALLNLAIPLPFELHKIRFYLSLPLGALMGVAVYLMIWLGDPKQANFMRIMKLVGGFFFLVLVISYFIFDPPFNNYYYVYWMSLMGFGTAMVMAPFVDRSERATSFFDWFKYKRGWDMRVQLFPKPRRK